MSMEQLLLQWSAEIKSGLKDREQSAPHDPKRIAAQEHILSLLHGIDAIVTRQASPQEAAAKVFNELNL